MKTNKLSVAFAVSAGLLAAAPATAQDYPELDLKLGHFLPATFSQANWDQWWADEVGKRSGGKINVEVFWAGALGGPSELLELVSSGAIDLAAFPLAYYPNELPVAVFAGTPLTFESAQIAHDVTMDVYAAPVSQAEMETNNISVVMSHVSAPYRLACTKEIATLADLEGMRVRAVGDTIPKMWQSVGVVPVNMPAGEVYEGLQRGNVDCAWMAYDMVQASKIYEVTQYASTLNLGAVSTWQIVMNREDAADRFPPEVVELFHEVAQDAMQMELDQVASGETDAIASLQENGLTMVEFQETDALMQAIDHPLDLWMADMEARGLAADTAEIAETLKAQAAQF